MLLEVKDIQVYYGAIHAIKGVSFEVNEGEIVTLIGANGAGKTTTLDTIAGLLRSRGGDIVFQGESIAHKAPHLIVKDGLALVLGAAGHAQAQPGGHEQLLAQPLQRRDACIRARVKLALERAQPAVEIDAAAALGTGPGRVQRGGGAEHGEAGAGAHDLLLQAVAQLPKDLQQLAAVCKVGLRQDRGRKAERLRQLGAEQIGRAHV